MANTSPIDIPVFAGHGTTAANSLQTRQQAQRDAASSTGSFLLSSCHQAFHTELQSLTPTELNEADIDLSDFATPESLLQVPSERYLHNPIASGSSLFLIQSLRYIAHVEASGAANNSLTPFSDILKRNQEQAVGILGFSSGILPAVVAASSFTAATFVSSAVEAYRLALWMGVRTQLYRASVRNSSETVIDPAAPWGLVVLGLSKGEVEKSISQFETKDSLNITAVTDNVCVTVSGHPTYLAAFAATLPTGTVVSKTTLDTLYHSPIHENGARNAILEDVERRAIAFPTLADVKVPVRHSLDGQPLWPQNTEAGSEPLVKLVVDMLMIQRVNWDVVLEKIAEQNVPVRLINVGPGAGLCRSMVRAFPSGIASMLDLTVDSKSAKVEPKQEPIAIVGMAVNMPGAPNIDKLWDVLEQGINTIAEIPEHRFKVADYNNPKVNKNRAMKAHTGNFLDNVDEFDNKFFKISPREAKNMDPQQRLLLHASYEALENAGYVPNGTPNFAPETFGAYIGVATHDYLQNLRNDIDVYYSTGTLKAFLSGRISYAMQLSGPSVVIDTACSSSIVAVYQGCRALMNKDCNAALVGGINTVSSPDMFLGLDRGHFLSPTGQCKAFDSSADGYSRSEGVGMFVLKRLSDALAENDNILGVIRGIEVNQSGLSHSITHPHAPTQSVLFKQVLENTGIAADRINVVEAHGTGTQAGDPNELKSIRSIFAVKRSPQNPLHITSIKANIGHLEAASGAAGLAKLLLMLEKKTIPRQISLKNLNPSIEPLEQDNTIIDTKHAPWNPSHEGLPRLAMLNNFGAAGSNTTLLLEEFTEKSQSARPKLPLIFGMSAKTETALKALREKYLSWLKSSESASVNFNDIAYTSTARRQIYSQRLAVSAADKEDLIQKLAKANIVQAVDDPSQIVFVFSGQGGQYIGMGRGLYETTPAFKKIVDECDSFLKLSGYPGVLPIIVPGENGSGLTALEEFEANQAAIFTLEYALAKVWMSYGLAPVAVVGHSLGEYAALVIAKVLSVRDALTLIASRVRLMVQKCAVDSTSMIAINLGPEGVTSALAASPEFSELSIACYNSPVDCVVSGPVNQLKSLKIYLDTEVHCKSIILSVPFGYHSSAMAPLLEEFTELCKKFTVRAPTVPVVSNVFGSVVMPGDGSVFDHKYLARHCAEPVQFDKGINALCSRSEFAKIDVWLEIGPHPTTLPMLKSNATVPKSALLLSSLNKKQETWTTLSTSLSQLYHTNASIRWREVFAHIPSVACVKLPSYAFETQKFWVPFIENVGAAAAAPVDVKAAEPDTPVSGYSMVRKWNQEPSSDNGFTAIFETPIRDLAHSIQGHSVGGMPLCPASVYLEQVYVGVELALKHLNIPSDGSHPLLRGIEFAKPLVYSETVPRTVLTTIKIGDGVGTFSIGSRVDTSTDVAEHVHGEYRLQTTKNVATKFARALPLVSRQMAAVLQPRHGIAPEVFSTRTVYEVVFPRVVDYAKPYHTIQSLSVETSGMEGRAIVKMPTGSDQGTYVVHPVFMDTLLHVAGFVANMQGGANDAYICSEVGSVKVIPDEVDNNAQYIVYCNNTWLPDEGIMLAEAHAVKLGEPNKVVAHLKGMHFRRVRLNSLKKSLAYAAGNSHATASALRAAAPKSKPSAPVAQTKFAAPVSAPAARQAPRVDVSAQVIKIIAETCDVSASNVDSSTDLASLGVDSLMSIEIFSKLQDTFPGESLDAQKLSGCETVGDIIKEVSLLQPQAASGASTPMTLVQDDIPTASVQAAPTATVSDADVKQVLAEVLGLAVGEIEDDAELDSLGLDSLTSIEALQALKDAFSLDLSSNLFTDYPTARAVNKFIASQLSSQPKHVEEQPKPIDPSLARLAKALRLDSIPVSIQTSQSRTRLPLFLIHDGSGLVNYYDRLSPLDRTIWGINNPNFLTAKPWDNLGQMASHYAEHITSKTSTPILIGGWSFGGIAAYEIAQQLQKRGYNVKGILLIDSPSPANHVPLSDSLLDAVINSSSSSAPPSDLAALIKAQFRMSPRLLGAYTPYSGDAHCPPIVLLRSRDGFKNAAVKDVPTWLADRESPESLQAAVTGWEELAGGPIKVLDIPGTHFEAFQPRNMGEISQRISEACEYLEMPDL